MNHFLIFLYFHSVVSSSLSISDQRDYASYFPSESPQSQSSSPEVSTRELRLVNGSNQCAGRVEIYHNKEWGTVCDDDWGIEEATVVCKYLGCGAAVLAQRRAHYGQGVGPIMLDDVECTGYEWSLKTCSFRGWKNHNCDHDEDAGVHCTGSQAVSSSVQVLPGFHPISRSSHPSSELRLVKGPNSCSGRLEIYYNNEWGTVCNNGWGIEEAAVVCRYLGCGAPVSAQWRAYYGQGTGAIMLDYVNCVGSESSLKECSSRGWKVHNCGHSKDVGVQCTELRLVNGQDSCSGRVEVYRDNEWGTVCDNGWGMEEAEVVCRYLGCGGAVAAPGSARYGQGTGPVRLNNVNCTGSETSLKQCSFRGWDMHTCHHGKDAGVLCGEIRLVNGSTPCSGRVEIYHNNEWGTVCRNNWGMEEATVVCRQLGCGIPNSAPQTAQYGPGTGPIMLDDLYCIGNERSLKHCSSRGWKRHKCSHHEDVGVHCGELRLVDGPTPCSGRVEIYHNKEWGTVCDDNWGMNEATVVCRHIGCGIALSAPGRAQYGKGTGPIMLDDVKCVGYEHSLKQCASRGWNEHNCHHEEDAGVKCTGLVRQRPTSQYRNDLSSAASLFRTGAFSTKHTTSASVSKDKTSTDDLQIEATLSSWSMMGQLTPDISTTESVSSPSNGREKKTIWI